MTFVVPFDGSENAEQALVRARDLAAVLDKQVLTIAVIPDRNTAYAREQGWLDAGEAFDGKTIVSRLRKQVHDVAPDATFEYDHCSRSVTGNRIAKPIRKFAKRNDAEIVFIGSDNTGRLLTTAANVGSRVATDGAYDVVLVRNK